jgi:hypothetical protein
VKKISSLLIACFLFLPFFVFASDDSPEVKESARGEIRVPGRTFETGFNIEFGFANNALSMNEIFQKTLILDLEKLDDGLEINLCLGVMPLYFKYDSGREWGFGFSTAADAVGILGLSGETLSLKKTEESKSDLSGAVFGSVGIDTFFRIQKFKIKFRPAVYYTFVYIKSDISYTNNDIDQGTQLFINLGSQFFTAYSLETSKITAEPGADFSLTVEYPLSKETGINEKFPILDFDVGVDFVNVPIVSSTIKSYEKTSTVLGSKEPVSVEELMSAFGLGDAVSVYGESDEKVYRPFKMLFRADWRPFIDKVPLSIIPTIGFSVCQLYVEPAAIEAGLKARLDFANRFIFTLGIGYYDRLWKNSIDLALNFRAVELNIGADLRAQDFAQSWEGYGFGLRVGFKFGW